jgi:staphylopine/pseudopaline/yersinopine synthase
VNEPILGSVLILGSGPAAIQTAKVIRPLCSLLGIASRHSSNWKRRYQLLQSSQQGTCIAAKESLTHLAGDVRFDNIYADFTHLNGDWSTLLIATPSHAFLDVLSCLPDAILTNVKRVVLLSSLPGGTQMVKGLLQAKHLSPEIIVFSNYFAASKFLESAKDTKLSVLTKAVKKRIYAHSNHAQSPTIESLKRALTNIDVEVLLLDNAFSAEGRNITLYVHPAFFITPFSLNHIVSQQPTVKYMYKLFPEGPITPDAIKTLVNLWRDISCVITHFGGQPINLLQFLNDDNYPVHPETLSRDQIEHFCELSTAEQEYLIYIRYSAILIDPFSPPDEQGRYFDFSAVPYSKGSIDNGKLQLPRIPMEDLQSLYWIKALATSYDIEVTNIQSVLTTFELWVEENQYSTQIIEQLNDQAQNALHWALIGKNNHE